MKAITAFVCAEMFVLSGFAQRKIINQMKQADHEIKRLRKNPFYKKTGNLEKKRENSEHDKNHYLKINSAVTLYNPVFTYKKILP